MISKQFHNLKGRKANILGSERFFKSAVLLPLVEQDGRTSVLFEVRAKDLRRQPGEICFPGGMVESIDSDPAQAAIRETCEELGLAEEDIKIIAPLDFLVTPFNTIIYPFLCTINDYTRITPNPNEVEEVFCVPLDYLYSYQPLTHHITVKLLLLEDFPFELIPNGKNYNWQKGTYPEYFFIYNDHIIWGMTARILHNFLNLTRDL